MTQFRQNTWYMFGWSDEFAEKPLARKLLNNHLVGFRTAAGPQVLLDRCPHRFAPLSRGRVEGDAIVCGYHGLAFNGAGACVGHPFSERAPPNAKVRAFPVVEKNGIVWVWPGNVALADPALVPTFDYLDAADRILVKGYSHVSANYELCADNLMDLSHIEFVHTGTFAGAGVIFAGAHSVVETEESILSRWWMPDIPPPPWAKAFMPSDRLVDHWLDMRWTSPSIMDLTIGLDPKAGPNFTIERRQAHIVTPESGTTTHYFWAAEGPEAEQGPAAAEVLKASLSAAFDGEDKPMIEAVQAALGDAEFWSAKPVILSIDAAAVRVRQRLQRQIAEEQGP